MKVLVLFYVSIVSLIEANVTSLICNSSSIQ